MQTWNSGPKVPVSHPKTTDEGWDIETSNSEANYAVFQAQNDM